MNCLFCKNDLEKEEVVRDYVQTHECKHCPLRVVYKQMIDEPQNFSIQIFFEYGDKSYVYIKTFNSPDGDTAEFYRMFDKNTQPAIFSISTDKDITPGNVQEKFKLYLPFI